METDKDAADGTCPVCLMVLQDDGACPVAHAVTEPVLCPTCGRPRDLVRICADCAATYLLSAAAARWYAARSLSLPRRCPACRLRRRQ